jgi:hypothetical protein
MTVWFGAGQMDPIGWIGFEQTQERVLIISFPAVQPRTGQKAITYTTRYESFFVLRRKSGRAAIRISAPVKRTLPGQTLPKTG